jgi:hypothetical protein
MSAGVVHARQTSSIVAATVVSTVIFMHFSSVAELLINNNAIDNTPVLLYYQAKWRRDLQSFSIRFVISSG